MSPFIPSKYSGSNFGDLGDVSQGGYPAGKDPIALGLVTVSVPVESGNKLKMTVRKEIVPAFTAIIQWWDKNIEPVTELGSYSYREIANLAGVLSNHSAGLAIDVNATKHPHWKRTLSQDQYNRISEKASSLGLTWGGNWSDSWADEMHFEPKLSLDKVLVLGESAVKNHWQLGLTILLSVGALGVVGAVYYRKKHHSPLKLHRREIDIID